MEPMLLRGRVIPKMRSAQAGVWIVWKGSQQVWGIRINDFLGILPYANKPQIMKNIIFQRRATCIEIKTNKGKCPTISDQIFSTSTEFHPNMKQRLYLAQCFKSYFVFDIKKMHLKIGHHLLKTSAFRILMWIYLNSQSLPECNLSKAFVPYIGNQLVAREG